MTTWPAYLSGATMTDIVFFEPDRYIEIFCHSLSKLRVDVDNDGLASGHDMADLNAIAMMCRGAKMIASAGRDVHDVLLAHLADATEALLMTAVIPSDGS